jgi:hypothetical protein
MRGQAIIEYFFILTVMIAYFTFVIIPLYEIAEKISLEGLKIVKLKTAINMVKFCAEYGGEYRAYFPIKVKIYYDDINHPIYKSEIEFVFEDLNYIYPIKYKGIDREIACDYVNNHYKCSYKIFVTNDINYIDVTEVEGVWTFYCIGNNKVDIL